MPTLFVTYGSNTRLAKAYSKIHGPTLEDCYNELNITTQGKYAFSYLEEQFVGQPEKYGLHEVPLQPMSAYD